MERLRLRTLIGIFLISSTTLCLEISLTRYFSISQQYHFAFLVVSIAFLGYGASGSFLSILRIDPSIDRDKFLSLTSLLFSLTVFLSFFICNLLPFDLNKMAWDSRQIIFLLFYYILLSIPFLFAGMTLAFAIARTPRLVTRIYFADLFGAGTGALCSILIFLPRGDRGVVLILSFSALIASFLFGFKRSILYKIAILCTAAAAVALFLYSPSWLSFRMSAFKSLPLALRFPQANHRITRWNALSRIDILESPAVRYAPGLSLLYDKNLPPQLGLTIDGDELTAVTGALDLEDESLEFLSSLPSSFPYFLLENPRVLILEPKGGLDVLASSFFNASRIKIVESNPLIVQVMEKELASFSGHLYSKEDVTVTVAHSRAALKKEKKSYDLIVFPPESIFAPAGTGLYGFSENYLLTLESFMDILQRLTPQGMAATTLNLIPPPRKEIRILATWIEALEQSQKDPSAHLTAIRSWGTMSFFIKKTPFSEKEIQTLKDFAERCLFDLVYYPGIMPDEVNIHNVFDRALYHDLTLQLLSPSKREALYQDYLFQITPVRDNSPFFFNFFKPTKLKKTYRALHQKWLPFLQGEFLVPIILIQSVAVAYILIVLPLCAFRKRKKARKGVFPRVFSYFALIGTAFMFVEITLIQKFILFLGHPLYSAAFIIFSLLFSSGVGSLSSAKLLGKNITRNLRRGLILCAGLIAAYAFILSALNETLIALGPLTKMLLAFLMIFPLGFLMGIPFPTGIRLLDLQEKRLIPWAWAVNAFSSVVSSVLALLVAFWAGYTLALLLAAGGYLLTLPFLGFSYHRDKADA